MTTASGESVSRGDLPVFTYHPDPVATGSVVRREVNCASCGLRRGYTYVGPVYAIDELGDSLCPWCVADGSAAERFDAEYNDVPWTVPGEVSEEVTDIILHRTLGFSGWQQGSWMDHCGDAAVFLGPAGYAELSGLPDVLEMIGLDFRASG